MITAGLLLVAAQFGSLFLALGLLWRIGGWTIHAADLLTNDEGRPIGSEAPQIAGFDPRTPTRRDVHLSFGGIWTFLVFGTRTCKPCEDLLRIAARHPATSWMRLVYVGDGEPVIAPEDGSHWEMYEFDAELSTRKLWSAPVSPYFYVVDPSNRIAAKGVANAASHLDRLFAIRPTHDVRTTWEIGV